jgi:hypothetical protein
MQLDFILIHIVVLVGNLWIVRQGIEGIARRTLQINLHVYQREYVNAPAFALSLAYLLFGGAATILTVLSFFQTDYRLLQLVGVILIAWLMTNIVANWFTHEP